MGKTGEIGVDLQKLQATFDYCHGSVFDETTSHTRRKSIKFLLLLREADKALNQIKDAFYAGKLL